MRDEGDKADTQRLGGEGTAATAHHGAVSILIMAARATPAWFQTELSYLNAQAHERLEEFAFYVAEDIDWLNDYARVILEKEPIDMYDIVKTPAKAKGLGQRSPFKELTNVRRHHCDEGADQKIRQSPLRASPFKAQASPKRPRQRSASPENTVVAETQVVPQLTVLEAPEDTSVEMDMSDTDQAEHPVPKDDNAAIELIGEELMDAAEQPAIVPSVDSPVQTANLSSGQDYLEAVHLASPPKRSLPQVSSPTTLSSTTGPSRSPRQSITFASLPPRQPFAKKSLGHRSSQSRSSVFDGTRSLAKTPASDRPHAGVKEEPMSTPRLLPNSELVAEQIPVTKAETPMMKLERSSIILQPIQSPAEVGYPVPASVTVEKAAATGTAMLQQHRGPATKPIKARSTLSDTSVRPVSPIPQVNDDDEWLPKFGKAKALSTLAKPTVAESAILQLVQSKMPSPVAVRVKSPAALLPAAASEAQSDIARSSLPTRSTTPVRDETATTTVIKPTTPAGPIRAAMQAASAKATAYLKQARVAFGSPAMAQGRVFSTTPKASPPKMMLKAEPQTPNLYPDLSAMSRATVAKPTAPVQRPSAIPAKATKQSPAKPLTAPPESASQATSPKRISPRRVLSTDMAAAAASKALATGSSATTQQPASRQASPRKFARVVPKFNAASLHASSSSNAQPGKLRPVSVIRVATASQLEKERKAAVLSAASINTQQTTKKASLSGGSSSSSGGVVVVPKAGLTKGLLRPIKALAAAEQAKERAERDQERREMAKRDVERKRQEAVRQAEEEEQARRKTQAEEAEMRKRKLQGELGKASVLKKVVRPGMAHAAHKAPMEEAAASRVSSVKRPHDMDEKPAVAASNTEAKRRRTNEQQAQPVAPVRASLQKKSLHAFGQPGEPGYKKPGAFKPAGPLETVKFSSETIRFAQAEAGPSVAQATQTTVTATSQLPPSELIKLPDIDSEYSDSDDDVPIDKNKFTLPGWAESPELRKLLRRQQRIDPDAVFGPVQPLHMEEIFKDKERSLARFRPRSSSANWTAMGDGLTQEEVRAYAQVMGYKN
jgi:hypothetical protein